MLPLELGWQTFKRMMKTAEFHGGIMKKILNGRKALVLTRMVVVPELQGKGLGSKYLQEVLEKVADAQNLPVVLSTQSMRNVNFYKKRSATLINKWLFLFLLHSCYSRDFTIVEELEYQYNGNETDRKYMTYFMIREPKQRTM
jgi:GNAT superfamily N-acetyltransferase